MTKVNISGGRVFRGKSVIWNCYSETCRQSKVAGELIMICLVLAVAVYLW